MNLTAMPVQKLKSAEERSSLVVGGDLVYPVGSENSYRDRFKGPLRFVAPDRREPGLFFLQHREIMIGMTV
ncbi:hypothetical protein EJ377_04735 [Chryseobacterium arthrosphaerae]|uniref:Uncharacterized protein n=1 Tax=Chryseobacterium arthrosphaerae TaxID=651561 RepID=A0A3S0VJD4_9FLAO|nr:hypothetical protein EJ377_04735 [Chryseobacterium arthrosphaerae]